MSSRTLRPQCQGHRKNHEHHRAPGSRLRQRAGCAPRTKRRLASSAAKRSGQVSRLAALEQYYDDQHQAVHHEKRVQQQRRKTKSNDNHSESQQQRDHPLHPTWHWFCTSKFLLNWPLSRSYRQFTIAANDLASRLPPPTSAPSSSGCAINPWILSGLTLPPSSTPTPPATPPHSCSLPHHPTNPPPSPPLHT